LAQADHTNGAGASSLLATRLNRGSFSFSQSKSRRKKGSFLPLRCKVHRGYTIVQSSGVPYRKLLFVALLGRCGGGGMNGVSGTFVVGQPPSSDPKAGKQAVRMSRITGSQARDCI
jgi:hypothetical protein